MGLGTIFLLTVAMVTAGVSAQSNSSSTDSMFGKIPQGNYTAASVVTANTGSLQALFDMAQGFVEVVFQPFSELAVFIEAMLPTIQTGELGVWAKDNWQDVAKFEAGYIACLVFGVLFIIFVPLVGSIMCCCRCCCNNCGGRLEQTNPRSKSCWRQCLCVSMLLLTVLMAIPTVFVFLTNEWITDVVDTGPKQIVAVLNDTSEYLSIFPKQINYVADEYNTVDDNVRPLVTDFGKSVGVPFQTFVNENAQESLQALDDAAKVQTNVLSAIATVNTSLEVLETGMVTLDNNLTTLQNNMTNTLNDSASGGVCTGDDFCRAVLASADNLAVGFDVASISPLKDELASVNSNLENYNISALQADVQKEIDDIPETVTNQTKEASTSAVDALDEAKDAVDEVSTNLPTDSLDEIDQRLETISGQITNAINGYDENFDQYRYIAFLVLGSMLAVIVACYLLGMVLGVCGHDRKVSPGNRGTASNCGGIWLMVGVGFTFIFSWLLMILVVVMFTVGGHGERYGCMALDKPDYEALELVEDIAGLNLTETLGLPAEAGLSLAGLLNSCERDESAYNALRLEYIYNVTDYLGNVTQQMDSLETDMDDAVNKIDLDEFVVYTKENQQDLLALNNSGIEDVNFTRYLDDLKLGSGITKVDLTDYATFLRASADNFTTAASFQAIVREYADEVDRIQREEVDGLQDDYDNLKSSIDALSAATSEIPATIEVLDDALLALNDTIQSDSKAEITEITDALYKQVSGNITAYVGWAGKQITDEVGACKPVYDAYAVTVGVFCDYLIDTINGLWFSLGWCIFFLIPSAIVAMKLMKFFRRMNFDDVFEDSWDDMEMRDYGAPDNNKANGAYY